MSSKRTLIGRGLGLALIFSVAGCSDPSSSRSLVANTGRSGREIFEACLLCHSTREMQRGPILDGLPYWYVQSQLEKFRLGIRGTNVENRSALLMAAGLSSLSNRSELRVVANYISRLPPQPHLLTVRGDVAHGKQVYQICLPCHGDRGQGNVALKGPPLRLLEDWYMLDQARKIQAGVRGGHAADLDARSMRAAVLALREQDFHDVIRYIAQELAPAHLTNAWERVRSK
jgi:cytochrome c oxidase subunit II